MKDEALRLALEYVELVPDDRYNADHIDRDALITAIKAALEAKDEPEYYGLTKDHLWMSISKEHYDRLKPEFRMACYTIPPQRTWVGLTKEERHEISMANRPYCANIMAAHEEELKRRNNG